MKKVILIIGIIVILSCVISLLYAALNYHGYHNIYDGSKELYQRLHTKMIAFAILGIVLAFIGAVCIIIYIKM